LILDTDWLSVYPNDVLIEKSKYHITGNILSIMNQNEENAMTLQGIISIQAKSIIEHTIIDKDRSVFIY